MPASRTVKPKPRSESWIMLMSSLLVVAIGLFVILTAPLFQKWLAVEYKELNLPLTNAAIPSGYGICLIGLLMLLIYRMPDIVDVLRRRKN